ncbi:MAG: imidazolonepropionase, partial [Bacteroidales bacterium]|nr:imidazolonepropionase [Bacteroidales bacterium]
MMKLLIENIKELIQVEKSPKMNVAGREMANLETIKDAYLYIDEGKIAEFGSMTDIAQSSIINHQLSIKQIDATGKMVFPCWCDSHTHLVYPQSREIEYIDKIKGLSYEEIAKRGGGILNSAKRMHETSEDELVESALKRLEEITIYGTGAVEIKSGYGLNSEDEFKMLRVIRRLKEISPLTIKA